MENEKTGAHKAPAHVNILAAPLVRMAFAILREF